MVGESWRQDGSWSQASGPDPSMRPSPRGTLWVYVAGKAGDTGGLWAARPPRLSLPLLHGLLRSPQGLPSPISPPSADRHRISRPWGIQLPHSQLLSNSRSDWSSSSLVTSPGPIIRAQGGQGLGGHSWATTGCWVHPKTSSLSVPLDETQCYSGCLSCSAPKGDGTEPPGHRLGPAAPGRSR